MTRNERLIRARILDAANHDKPTTPPRELEQALRAAGCPSQVRAHGRGQPGQWKRDDDERVRGSGG